MAFYIGFYAYAIIVHTWVDQLLPQLLMEQFDTMPIQCRPIEHMHEGVWLRIFFFLTKWQLWELRQFFPDSDFVYALMVPSWADQLLQQFLMEPFDTLPKQCRHIELMHEGVWFRKNNVWQNDNCENLDNFLLIRHLYMRRWCFHGPINSYHSFWWLRLLSVLRR